MLYQFTTYITNKCNLACPYCHVRQSINNPDYDFMSYQSTLDEIKLTCKNRMIDKTQNVLIEVLGGEPLIDLPNLKRFIEEADILLADYSEVYYLITTNMTIWNQEIEDYIFSNNRIKLLVSLNGVGPEKNSQRVFANGDNAFPVVEANLKDLKARRPDFNDWFIGTSCALLEENSKHLHEVFDYMYDNYGIKNVMMAHDDFVIDQDVLDDMTLDFENGLKTLKNKDICLFSYRLFMCCRIDTYRYAHDPELSQLNLFAYRLGYVDEVSEDSTYHNDRAYMLYKAFNNAGLKTHDRFSEYMTSTNKQNLIIEKDGVEHIVDTKDFRMSMSFIINIDEMIELFVIFPYNTMSPETVNLMTSAILDGGAKFTFRDSVTGVDNLLLTESSGEITEVSITHSCIFIESRIRHNINNV